MPAGAWRKRAPLRGSRRRRDGPRCPVATNIQPGQEPPLVRPVIRERERRRASMAKMDTLKLPKTIAGVKVPKFLRHPGTILEILNSPAGRLVIAEVLIAAAAAL